MSSEKAGLEDLHAFLKLGNNVTRFSFPHIDRPLIAPSFVARDVPEGDMWLNPLAPAKPKPAASSVPAAATTTPAGGVATAPVPTQTFVKEKVPSVTPTSAVDSTPPPADVPAFGPAVLVAVTHPSSDL